jgi:hypothetical protein
MPFIPGSPSEGDEVGNQFWRDPVARHHLLRPHALGTALAAAAEQQHRNRFGGALEHVAIAREDQCDAPGFLLDARKRSEQIVGLQAVVVVHDPAERLVETWRERPLMGQIGWHGGPVGVIARVELHAVGRGVRPEAAHHRTCVLLGGHRQNRVRAAEQRVHRTTVCSLDLVGEAVESPVHEVRGIHQ